MSGSQQDSPRTTADGSSIDVYTRLPLGDEAEIVASYCPPGGSVLDLGAGAGRVANPLTRQGFSVTAVDDSAETLSHIAEARTVCTRIEDLQLGEPFDVVLLASHLVNTTDTALREALVSAAARHTGPTGHVLIQRHPPGWFDSLAPAGVTRGRLGAVEVELTVLALSSDQLTATVRYLVNGRTWTHDFKAQRLQDDALNATLVRHGLKPGITAAVGGKQHADWIVSALEDSRVREAT